MLNIFSVFFVISKACVDHKTSDTGMFPLYDSPIICSLLVKTKWYIFSLQNNVFGAGYPSLPTMTQDEYFEKELREGKIVAEFR